MAGTVLNLIKRWWAGRNDPPTELRKRAQPVIERVEVDEHETLTIDGPPNPHVVKQIESLLPPDDVLDNMTDDEAMAYGLNQLFAAEERGFAEYRHRRRKARHKIRDAVRRDGVKDAKIDDTY